MVCKQSGGCLLRGARITPAVKGFDARNTTAAAAAQPMRVYRMAGRSHGVA